jgi:hypothetical protein
VQPRASAAEAPSGPGTDHRLDVTSVVIRQNSGTPTSVGVERSSQKPLPGIGFDRTGRWRLCTIHEFPGTGCTRRPGIGEPPGADTGAIRVSGKTSLCRRPAPNSRPPFDTACFVLRLIIASTFAALEVIHTLARPPVNVDPYIAPGSRLCWPSFQGTRGVRCPVLHLGPTD